jgi:transposase InsO family protein
VAADITYIPVNRGFMYLVAVMDWHSRKVLSRRLSNSGGPPPSTIAEAKLLHDGLQGVRSRYENGA